MATEINNTSEQKKSVLVNTAENKSCLDKNNIPYDVTSEATITLKKRYSRFFYIHASNIVKEETPC